MHPQASNRILNRRAPIAGLPLVRDADEEAALSLAAFLVGMAAARDAQRP